MNWPRSGNLNPPRRRNRLAFLFLLLVGAAADNELRGYFIHEHGVSEPLEQYGTIGSGAAYAELFLRYLITGPQIDVKQAARLAVYTIKGVGLMDPNVGGDTNVTIITTGKQGGVDINVLPNDKLPGDASATMEDVLKRIGASIKEVVSLGGESNVKDPAQAKSGKTP